MVGIGAAMAGSHPFDSKELTSGVLAADKGGLIAEGFSGYDYSGGSLDSTTSNLFSGVEIRELWWHVAETLILEFAGALPNGGWTVMDIEGTQFLRSDASYVGTDPSYWAWTSVSTSPIAAPTTYTVRFW